MVPRGSAQAACGGVGGSAACGNVGKERRVNLGSDSADARRADVSEETKYLRNIAVGVEEVHGPAGIGVLAVKLASLALTSEIGRAHV